MRRRQGQMRGPGLKGMDYLPLLRITDAMRIFGLTARALRFYEDRGLLEVGRDRKNARYYDLAARRRLEWISSLRRAGLSLNAIEDVLSADDASGDARACALAKLERRREEVGMELSRVMEAIRMLSAETQDTAELQRRAC
jgi:DNA-binding transcriptional MerR regulator